MNVYVVMGVCGEYSDRSVWNAHAYTTKEAAESARDEIERLANTAIRSTRNSDDESIGEDLARAIEAIDAPAVWRHHETKAPRWAFPYEQPEWGVQEIPLARTV